MHLICGWDHNTIQKEIRVSEDGEIVVNMGAYSALVLKEMDVNYG